MLPKLHYIKLLRHSLLELTFYSMLHVGVEKSVIHAERDAIVSQDAVLNWITAISSMTGLLVKYPTKFSNIKIFRNQISNI